MKYIDKPNTDRVLGGWDGLLEITRVYVCRNCLVGAEYRIKVSDTGILQPLYSPCYYGTEERIPLRWMPWETVTRVSSVGDITTVRGFMWRHLLGNFDLWFV